MGGRDLTDCSMIIDLSRRRHEFVAPCMIVVVYSHCKRLRNCGYEQENVVYVIAYGQSRLAKGPQKSVVVNKMIIIYRH